MNVKAIIEGLYSQHPDAVCELNYRSEYELLVSVMLSQQCTDKRVNVVTEGLFKQANTPQTMLSLGLEQLEQIIKPCGFYHNKARNIIIMSEQLILNFGGVVPNTMEQLITLQGVGRKSANVMLAVAFGQNAIAVDTHVFRVANRIGLAEGKTPFEVEKQLMQRVDEQQWSILHHLLIHHGRYCCKAIKPQCNFCLISQYCKYYAHKITE